MFGTSGFWRAVADEGVPWGLILPLMGIIVLVLGIGFVDQRREETDGSKELPWWTELLLFYSGLFGIIALFFPSFLPRVLGAWAYLRTAEGLQTVLLIGLLLGGSVIVLMKDAQRAIRHAAEPVDTPIVAMLVLSLQAGAVCLIARYFPWRINGQSHSYGVGYLLEGPFLLAFWLAKIAIGVTLIKWVLKMMLPRLLELGEWLPGAMRRRPLTGVVVLFWGAGLWYWLS